MQAPYFPDWRGVYRSEHLPGIFCTSRNMFSGYINMTSFSTSSQVPEHFLKLLELALDNVYAEYINTFETAKS